MNCPLLNKVSFIHSFIQASVSVATSADDKWHINVVPGSWSAGHFDTWLAYQKIKCGNIRLYMIAKSIQQWNVWIRVNDKKSFVFNELEESLSENLYTIRLFWDNFDNWKANCVLFQSNCFCLAIPHYRLATDSLFIMESRFLERSLFRKLPELFVISSHCSLTPLITWTKSPFCLHIRALNLHSIPRPSPSFQTKFLFLGRFETPLTALYHLLYNNA